ncbi:MAG: TlpA family protein disulfide reductase [Acidimicrobiia bacterium]|nr:TlpA family protein disulfide reductase [Acidimicrobiia bacterium]
MKGSRIALISAVVVGVIVLLLVIVLATRDPAADRVTRSPLISKPAPPIAGRTIEGQPFDLSRYEGEWVVVNFFATWCGPCKQEHPELVKLAQGDVTNVVSVVFQDDPGTVKAFLKEHGGHWPVINDPTGKITLEYGVPKIPESYLIAPDGTVVAKFISGIEANAVTKLISSFSGRAHR